MRIADIKQATALEVVKRIVDTEKAAALGVVVIIAGRYREGNGFRSRGENCRQIQRRQQL